MGEQSGRDQSRTGRRVSGTSCTGVTLESKVAGINGERLLWVRRVSGTSCTGVALCHLLSAPRPILVSVLFCRLIVAAARTLSVCCSFLVVFGWP